MNMINMLVKIILVSDQMRPKTALPQPAFTPFASAL